MFYLNINFDDEKKLVIFFVWEQRTSTNVRKYFRMYYLSSYFSEIIFLCGSPCVGKRVKSGH